MLGRPRSRLAWQYTAQIADEVVRSGVRSLLQSISIFRMREMADARSLAGLAMEIYSDHISSDHKDQQRLRFSADDITRLDHHAINLWVAQGTPRPGFIAQTLPWEDLCNQRLADHLVSQSPEDAPDRPSAAVGALKSSTVISTQSTLVRSNFGIFRSTFATSLMNTIPWMGIWGLLR